MKLVAYEEGRSLQLISPDEIWPLRGGPFLVDVATTISTRYRFMTSPQNLAQNVSRKFENGVIVIGASSVPILSFEIYTDGFLVSTRRTDESDMVLDEFLEWATAEFGLRRPSTIVPRQYVSRVIVDFDQMFDDFATAFSVLSQTAAEAFGIDSGQLRLTELQVGPFPPTQYPYKMSWTLVKRAIEPMVANRYMSLAPLSTGDHLAFLEQIERAIGPTART